MILAGDIRKGVTFVYNNSVYAVVEFQHVKPGKGAAFVRTKLKNVINGSVIEVTFNPSEKLEKAEIESRDMEYLYADGDIYYFMDPENYEQVPLAKAQVEDALKYMTENMQATIRFYNGEAFSVEPPNFVTLRITVCEPGAVGNTATNVTKPATLETGYQIMVPMFINEGDLVRIDTRTGLYMERAK